MDTNASPMAGKHGGSKRKRIIQQDAQMRERDQQASVAEQENGTSQDSKLLARHQRHTAVLDQEMRASSPNNTETSTETLYDALPHSPDEEHLSGEHPGVEGPFDDRYIRGTSLVLGGWFQPCRGCNDRTSHSTTIRDRQVPLCPRCQAKYLCMIKGQAPASMEAPDPTLEPLVLWLPKLLHPAQRLSDSARKEFCDLLMLRQDDAWLDLIRTS